MTRNLIRTVLFATLALLGPLRPAHAWFFQEVPDKTVTVRYRQAVAANISTAAVVVHLADTTTWPHSDTGQLNVSSIRIEIDKVAASTGTVKLGVVNFVDSSTGSVTWFYSKESTTNVSNTNVKDYLSYVPNYLRLKVNPAAVPSTAGTTPYLLSNDTTGGSTTYQTDVKLPSPAGNTAPGAGDIVMFANSGSGAITVNLEIQYHAEQR